MILKDIALILKLYAVKDLIVARWGGEEFVIISPCTQSYNDFVNTLIKINTKVRKTKFKTEQGKDIKITVSIGSSKIEGNMDFEEAISLADKNLYKAKETGRNKVVS